MANTFRGLLPDGTLPAEAQAQVEMILQDGGGVREVEGVMLAPQDGPRVREFYSVGEGVTMNGEFFPPDTAFVVRRRTTGGSDVAVVGEGGAWRPFGLPPEVVDDVTPPTAGTLSVTTEPTAATLTVTGAMDDVRLHVDGPYRVTRDEGETWTPWQVSPVHTFEGLAPHTDYTFQHEVRDQAGNTRLGGPVAASTPPLPVWSEIFTEDFTKPDGSVLGGTDTTTGGFTWVGDGGVIADGRLTTATPRGEQYVSFAESVESRVRATFDYEITDGGSTDRIAVGIGLTSAGGVNRSFYVGKSTILDKGHPHTGTLTLEWNPETQVLTTTLDDDVIAESEHPSTNFRHAGSVIVQPTGQTTNTVTIDNLLVEVDTA